MDDSLKSKSNVNFGSRRNTNVHSQLISLADNDEVSHNFLDPGYRLSGNPSAGVISNMPTGKSSTLFRNPLATSQMKPIDQRVKNNNSQHGMDSVQDNGFGISPL